MYVKYFTILYKKCILISYYRNRFHFRFCFFFNFYTYLNSNLCSYKRQTNKFGIKMSVYHVHIKYFLNYDRIQKILKILFGASSGLQLNISNHNHSS